MTRAVGDIDWYATIVACCKKVEPASHPKPKIVQGVAAQLPDVFTRLLINSIRRQAHFLSQSIIECQYYQTLEELASGDAYDTRTDLGFTAARDGDGRTNKGFGIFQTTGPTNQRRALAELLKLGFRVSQDVHTAKTVLTDPRYAAWTAGIYWRDNKLNAIADKDATGSMMSRAINRGNAYSKKQANGEAERLKAFRVCFAILQNPPLLKKLAAPVALMGGGEDLELPEIQGADVLEMGRALNRAINGEPLPDGAPGQDPAEHAEQVAAGEQPEAGPPSPTTPLPAEPVTPGVPAGMVAATQQRLRDLGFYGVGQATGDAGPRTVGAIASFQHVAELPVTGQLDQATMTAAWEDDAPRAPVEVERALATAKDLRPTSTVIDATAKVKTATIWQLGAGAFATVSAFVTDGLSSTMESLAGVRTFFTDTPGWVWVALAVGIGCGPALYALIQAHRAQKARVESYNRGETA